MLIDVLAHKVINHLPKSILLVSAWIWHQHTILRQTTGSLSGILREEAAKVLELHLQTLLRHRLPDGSFVEFAEYRDPMKGSTWWVLAL